MGVTAKIETLSTWKTPEAGSWADQNSTGARRADELLSRMRREDCPTLLGHTVRAMIAAGVYGGVEVGFFHRLAELALLAHS